MKKNSNLHKAKKAKNDEFYTRIFDIENELKHYKDHFKNKVVFLNCDDPEESNFWKFFEMNFVRLGLKKLIATHYHDCRPSYKLEIVGHVNDDGVVNDMDIIKTDLKENGDFRSPEAIEILKESDIVVTNPPFSLFREFISVLMEHQKKFLVIGNMNAITYKEIFKHIKNNELWLGVNSNKTMDFRLPDSCEKWNKIQDGNKYGTVPAICWFTNLEHNNRNEELILFREYYKNNVNYPKYDNYDAIEVSKTVDIPCDYCGAMGVPISFLTKYNPDQFEIIKFRKGDDDKDLSVNGKCPYFRVIIKNNVNYPKYDNYDAIEVSKTVDIPCDYYGAMGVPISFLTKYNPDQFEIIKFRKGDDDKDLSVNGKCPYFRVIIKNNVNYPKYDNYNAIEVSKTVDIPCDYYGAMGVPISFLTKYNPDQFEIIDSNDYRINNKIPYKEHGLIKDKESAIDGRPKYVRIVIKNRNPIIK